MSYRKATGETCREASRAQGCVCHPSVCVCVCVCVLFVMGYAYGENTTVKIVASLCLPSAD